jgi:hypothetical protein
MSLFPLLLTIAGIFLLAARTLVVESILRFQNAAMRFTFVFTMTGMLVKINRFPMTIRIGTVA